MIAVAVRLPETPSTPSEQLVALIESQITPVASGMASHGGRTIASFQPGSQIVEAATPSIATEAPRATTRSITASRYSLKPPRRSSR